jgi:hypothetical protein
VIGGLSMVIEHKLGGPDPQSVPPVEGSTITQTYTITNTTANPVTFSLVRHIDVDLGPVGGPGSYWTNDRAGASRQLADCSLGAPPFTHNKEWAFVYDTAEVAATVVAIGVEGLDHTGAVVRVFNLRTNGNTTGHPEAAFLTDPVAFTNGAVTGDTDGNLLVDEGTGADQALNNGVTFTAVPNGGTVKAIFSTRLSAMNSGTATPVEQQARDITCSTKNGNYSGAGAGPLLCVNGSGGGAGTACVNVPTGMAVNLQMHAPAGGPNPTHYILYAGLGEPQHGSGCGSPQAHDFAVWGGGIAPFGLGSFPVTSVLGNWTGGNAVPGFALVSSIPGVALLLGPPASGAACPGTTVFSIPGVLPDGFSFTAQAVAVDFGVIGTPVSVSNAVTVAVGSCGCQSH